ncbi:MAG: hypothetical protein U0T56_07800 [Ferruginibacter sp.]
MTNLMPLLYDNGLVYLAGQSSIATYPSTNGLNPFRWGRQSPHHIET